ncbi:3-oxoacyl-[acyl-carrier-protein] reductase FabG [Thalictrum thalictroides]|uniref:3-oxoacyl-[acyl-carrier-protein] reductase FabG n=1 Tax=Thalictrum thalictroides TaxID=46969 RepID=A0A7J6VUI0_THATH|nr:3-oxoacyl-[acyl-carrier-protein] reductase FabG [Thalictrum thalictroides]
MPSTPTPSFSPSPTTTPTPTPTASARASMNPAARTILITGVSKGLGKALALEIASNGHIVIGCSRSQDKLDSLRSSLSSPPHLLLQVDVTSDTHVAELAKTVIELKGIVPDIIVNNAGTINKNNRIWEVPVEEIDAVFDTNVKGTVNVLRHFLPKMVERKRGIVVNMSSGWGRSAAAQVAPYCASKWAIEGLTKSIAKELPPGMAIVALSPGVVNTDMLASCFGASSNLYQTPEAWAPKAAAMVLNLTAADNGGSLTI